MPLSASNDDFIQYLSAQPEPGESSSDFIARMDGLREAMMGDEGKEASEASAAARTNPRGYGR